MLLRLTADFAPNAERLGVAQEVIAVTARRGLPPPNIDFALAALVSVSGMVRGASEAIFGVARCAGWIAHAIDAYGSVEGDGVSATGADARTTPER